MNRLLLILVLVSVACFCAGSPPDDLSPYGVSEWVERGGQISSGTGALPAVASEGALYADVSTPTAPILYRSDGSTWQPLSSAGTGSGVSSHSLLTELDFASSGHTGFASESALLAHEADQTDPHGASMTVTESVTLGSGTADASVSRYAAGVIQIASYIYLPPETATPTSPASMTIWHDSNTNRLRVYDGSAWQDLW